MIENTICIVVGSTTTCDYVYSELPVKTLDISLMVFGGFILALAFTSIIISIWRK